MPTPQLKLPPPELNLIVPQGVRYDGSQSSRRGLHLCFTDEESGSSFALLATEINSVKLARITADVRRRFRAPSEPLPPLFQRKPRLFADAQNNYR